MVRCYEFRPRGVSFHHSQERLLPFAAANVARGIHNCPSHGAAGRRCSNLRKGENYLHATTVDKLHLPKPRHVQVKSRLVQRQFPEANCTVVVWAAYVKIEGSMFVHLEEKGWIIVKPYHFKTHNKVLNSPGAVVSRASYALLPSCSSEEDEKQHIGELSDLVIGTYHHNFGLLYQILENLIDNSMAEKAANK